MVNKERHLRPYVKDYLCPVCGITSDVKPDDSFLKAMVSQKQLENARLAQQIESECMPLRPFKAFLEMPCAVCGQPLTEWTDSAVRLVMRSAEMIHERCCNTPGGALWIGATATRLTR